MDRCAIPIYGTRDGVYSSTVSKTAPDSAAESSPNSSSLMKSSRPNLWVRTSLHRSDGNWWSPRSLSDVSP